MFSGNKKIEDNWKLLIDKAGIQNDPLRACMQKSHTSICLQHIWTLIGAIKCSSFIEGDSKIAKEKLMSLHSSEDNKVKGTAANSVSSSDNSEGSGHFRKPKGPIPRSLGL